MLRFIGWYWAIPWLLMGPYIAWSTYTEGQTVPAAVASVLFVVAVVLVLRLWRTRSRP